MHRSREWLFERIRQAHREQGLSGRELAARFKVSRNTVRKRWSRRCRRNGSRRRHARACWSR
ncbi:HTH domain-containing protein [Streptomyces sp. NPDC049837]|uniref:HTH domain-containing protein n=1 Tax=Streptomyces sp. NPDC049837 TaxID=3155277 RepID=UPI00341A6A79